MFVHLFAHRRERVDLPRVEVLFEWGDKGTLRPDSVRENPVQVLSERRVPPVQVLYGHWRGGTLAK